MVGETPGPIVESTLVTDVSPPSALEDASWVRRITLDPPFLDAGWQSVLIADGEEAFSFSQVEVSDGATVTMRGHGGFVLVIEPEAR